MRPTGKQLKRPGKSPVADRMATVERRLGNTTKGTAEKAKPKTSARPTGNPFKGKVGIRVKREW